MVGAVLGGGPRGDGAFGEGAGAVGDDEELDFAGFAVAGFDGVDYARSGVGGDGEAVDEDEDGGVEVEFEEGLGGGEFYDFVFTGLGGLVEAVVAAAAEFGEPLAVAADNLLMTGGDASLDEIIARTERALLLTTLWYIRTVDPTMLLLTGLTRDGVYLIEDGKVSAAVNNFRFNESPLHLLQRATEVGATEITLPREWGDWATRAAMPALMIPDFYMSSVSQAQ